jgi:penicillin-binding protein 1B
LAAGKRTRRKAGKAKARRREFESRRSRWRRFLRIAALALVCVGFVAGFSAARYTIHLDRIVRARFEGRLFRVPSRVMSAPTILYPGLDWKRIDLPGTLLRLGYREFGRSGAVPVGHFSWEGQRVRLHRRPFDHPSRAEPARDIVLRLSGTSIEELRDAQTGRELGALLLEPELVGAYYGPDHEQRELVRVEDVPPHLVDAILAVEDQRFLSHSGIDLRRIVGALWVNLRSGRVRQGGSTLTQQLVKNFFLTPERSVKRKLQEAAMAVIVEARYEKEAILESYLNEIYLGQRGSTAIHGVGEASWFYFGKAVHHISLPESALIAAIIQSPHGLSPHREVERATGRRNLVLRLMYEQGRVTRAQLEEAGAEPVRVAKVTPEPRDARFFLDALRRQLPAFYSMETLTTEGLRIYATLDLRLQRLAASALREELAALEKRYPALASGNGPPLEGCLIALRPQTGEVLALAGGRDYAVSQFDRCTQARRPAGSVFKPFVYIAALEPVPGGPRITLGSMLDDGPLAVTTATGVWRPANYDRKFHGQVRARDALERSLNVATARLAQEVGISRVADVAERLGIESPLPRVPSLAIGSADLSPLELARAYATIANGGIRPQIRTFEDVVDGSGAAVEGQPIGFERVLDAGTAYLAISLLEGVIDRGTGRGVRAGGIRGPIAGKTGTSDEERDAWFIGFSPELVVVVWVGFDEPRSLGLPSSRVALPVWIRFLREATGGQLRGRFFPPAEVVEVEIDPVSGALALAGCPRRTPEYFLRGTEPAFACPEWAAREREPKAPGGRRPSLLERLFHDWLNRL